MTTWIIKRVGLLLRMHAQRPRWVFELHPSARALEVLRAFQQVTKKKTVYNKTSQQFVSPCLWNSESWLDLQVRVSIDFRYIQILCTIMTYYHLAAQKLGPACCYVVKRYRYGCKGRAWDEPDMRTMRWL